MSLSQLVSCVPVRVLERETLVFRSRSSFCIEFLVEFVENSVEKS